MLSGSSCVFATFLSSLKSPPMAMIHWAWKCFDAGRGERLTSWENFYLNESVGFSFDLVSHMLGENYKHLLCDRRLRSMLEREGRNGEDTKLMLRYVQTRRYVSPRLLHSGLVRVVQGKIFPSTFMLDAQNECLIRRGQFIRPKLLVSSAFIQWIYMNLVFTSIYNSITTW